MRGFPVEFAILEDSDGLGRLLGFNNQSIQLTAVLLNLLFQDTSSDLDTFPFIEDPFSNENVPLTDIEDCYELIKKYLQKGVE